MKVREGVNLKAGASAHWLPLSAPRPPQDWRGGQPLRSNYPPPLFLCPDRYMSALSSYYASKGLALVAFERFLALRKTGAGGNHCHVNVIGVPKEAVGKAQDAFQQALKAADLGEFEVLQMGEGECGAAGCGRER